jgi:hypothetical protein
MELIERVLFPDVDASRAFVENDGFVAAIDYG